MSQAERGAKTSLSKLAGEDELGVEAPPVEQQGINTARRQS